MHQENHFKSETIFDNWKPFKKDEKCYFRSQDILLFGHVEKWFD